MHGLSVASLANARRVGNEFVPRMRELVKAF